MATKYCDVSLATGLNDGTSTANAWQSLVDVLDGTPVGGSYAAGDVIIIRTADGGGNLTESSAVAISVPIKSGTDQDTLVEWRFDDGTAWAQNGTFELTFTAGTNFTIGDYNWLNGGRVGTRRFQVKHNVASDFDLRSNSTKFFGVDYVRGTTPAASNETRLQIQSGALEISEFINCGISGTTPEGGGTNPTLGGLVEHLSTSSSIFIGCSFTLNSSISTDAIFFTSGTNNLTASVELIGCNVLGSVSSHGVYNSLLTSVRNFTIRMKDCNLGSLDEAQNAMPGAEVGAGFWIMSESAASTEFFSRRMTELVDYNPSGNYPTLSATLPDVSTAWAVRVWPDNNNCSVLRNSRIGHFTKWYNAAAATKDIRLEVLIKDTAAFASPQNDEWWIEVTYVDDADDSIEFETTQASGALTTSTESWSSTTYGGNTYDKYKFVLTTANSIKQYTFVSVMLKSTKPAINAASSASGDFYFVDPDFQIE